MTWSWRILCCAYDDSEESFASLREWIDSIAKRDYQGEGGIRRNVQLYDSTPELWLPLLKQCKIWGIECRELTAPLPPDFMTSLSHTGLRSFSTDDQWGAELVRDALGCTPLRELILDLDQYDTAGDPDEVWHLLGQCTHLQSLDISGTLGERWKQQALEATLAKLPRVRVLELRIPDLQPTSGLRDAVAAITRLRSLRLNKLNWPSVGAFQLPNTRLWEVILGGCSQTALIELLSQVTTPIRTVFIDSLLNGKPTPKPPASPLQIPIEAIVVRYNHRLQRQARKLFSRWFDCCIEGDESERTSLGWMF